MQEKIKWYQEVLELEPGSKVFFPLARLLAGTDQTDAALQTLQHGISRHPEFIEARLYLIDLLFKHQRTAQCDEQVAELTGLFSNYTGFWQAWGAYLAHKNKDTDISLALSFLAASFQNADLRLTDIFTQGLQAALQGAQSAPYSPPLNAEDSSDAESFDNNAPEFSQSDIALDESAAMPAPAPDVCEAAASPEAANGLPAEDPAPTVPPLSELVQSLPATPVFTLQDEESLSPDLSDDNDDNEERFSLRTRSMAEVLAEQGDFKNALDIYQELVAQATSPEEQLDLQHRISTLTARMGTVQNQGAESPASASETAPGKHRLLSLLETLAVRFEAHAQG